MTSVILPADCRICGDPLSSLHRVPVCSSCWNDLPSQSASICFRCGEDLGISNFGEMALLCRSCRLAPPALERAVAQGLYRGTIRSLLHLLKYEGWAPVAQRLGTLIAKQAAVMSGLPRRMLVVPVPLFTARRRARGFNPSDRLARAAVRAMRSLRPEWEGELAPWVLARQRATESQAGLSLHERRRNLRGAFSVSDPAWVRQRDVLLIDDIYTTGATARACSQVLKRAGAATVWVATVARAQRRQIEAFRPKAVADVPMHLDIAKWDGSKTLQ